MKSKISYSRFSIILTVLVMGALFIACIATVREDAAFLLLLATYLALFIPGLLYGPAYLKIDAGYIVLGSILRNKKILIHDVESVERYTPAAGTIRICASGGFLGYWGIFRDGCIGKYYGFYGKSSDCFIVRMKDGGNYVLGCDRPDEMISCLKSQMKMV